MGTMLVSDVFERASRLLNDVGAVRWTPADLLAWYNEGVLDAVTRRPTLLTAIDQFVCVAGTIQSVPSNRIALVEAGRNLGPAAAPVSGPVPTLMTKDVIDRLVPSWQADAAAATVTAVITSPLAQRMFWVYPPQPSVNPGRLELMFSKRPTTVVSDSETIEIQDEHAPIIIAYLLYRAMSVDAENPAMGQLATQQLQAYLGMLGVGQPAPQPRPQG